MKPISLYPNPKRDEDFVHTKALLAALSDSERTFLISEKYREAFRADFPRLSFVPEDKLFTDGEVLIPLGGDGTILSVAAKAAKANIPVLGINLGKVGFMAGLEKKDLARLPSLTAKDFTVSERMLLSCRVGDQKPLYALNEIVIAQELGFHIVEMDLAADRRKLTRFRADGIIFNTPTGSTGYSFSAGGAVTESELDCIGVKAISSYMLIHSHHMLFRPETRFTVSKIRSEGGRITVCADGRESLVVGEQESVTVQRAEEKLKLCFLGKKSNLEVFFRKF